MSADWTTWLIISPFAAGFVVALWWDNKNHHDFSIARRLVRAVWFLLLAGAVFVCVALCTEDSNQPSAVPFMGWIVLIIVALPAIVVMGIERVLWPD
jgi:hypothetical protein